MRDFWQFLVGNIIATMVAIVSLMAGIIEIVKFIKGSKDKSKKIIMVVSGVIFAIALIYLIFQYALMNKADATGGILIPTEDVVTTESELESESEVQPEKEEPSESTNTEDANDDTIKVEIDTNTGGQVIISGDDTTIINGTNSQPEVEVPVIVSSITLSESFLNMQVGQSQQISATVLYSDNSKDSNVIWVSSNETIATIDQNGIVMAHSTGEVEIIAQASRGNVAKEARCKIEVKAEPTGYTISLSTNKAFLHETFQVYVTAFEENTKIIVYGKAPSGTIYEFEYSKEKKFLVDTEIGIWTIYAKVENEFGVYEASKPEDFVTIEIVSWDDIYS